MSGDDFDILAVGSFSDKIRFDGAEVVWSMVHIQNVRYSLLT